MHEEMFLIPGTQTPKPLSPTLPQTNVNPSLNGPRGLTHLGGFHPSHAAEICQGGRKLISLRSITELIQPAPGDLPSQNQPTSLNLWSPQAAKGFKCHPGVLTAHKCLSAQAIQLQYATAIEKLEQQQMG